MNRRGSLISTPNKSSFVIQGSSIVSKCKSAEDYFAEHRWEFRNFYEFFPMFLLDLFGLDNKSWFDGASSSADGDALMQLLSPNSRLMQTIVKSAKDDSLKFIYPVAKLPQPTQKLFQNSNTSLLPSMYKGKFYLTSPITNINLNVFEYYFFCLAYFATNNKAARDTKIGTKSCTALWEGLLVSYLQAYCPSAVQDSNLTDDMYNRYSATFNSVSAKPLGIALLQILVEFWLTPQTTNQGNYQSEQWVPSKLHIHSANKLVQHVIAITFKNYQQQRAFNMSLFDIVNRPFFNFLRTCLTSLPADAVDSFHTLVDCWLSFLQPWKLVNTTFTDNWSTFIENNFVYYIQLLHPFLRNALHMDYNSTRDIQTLGRVVSLFCDPNLNPILIESEKRLLSYLLSASQFPGHTGGHQIGASMWTSCKFVAGPQVEYTPLLQGETVAVARQLVQKLKLVTSKAASNETRFKLSINLFDENKNSKKDLLDTIEHLKQLFQLPEVPEVKPSDQTEALPSRQADVKQMFEVDTYQNSKVLSPLGRDQIRYGLKKCNNMDVEYIGDPALSPITSTENATLVRFLYNVSVFYQRSVGAHTRPNFRVLASYQTHAIVAIVIFAYWFLTILYNTIENS